MKKKYSWSKPIEVSNIIGRKQVDWSIFEFGSTIPSDFHVDFDNANGTHLERGESREIKLIHKGQTYKATLTNIDRTNIKSNTYQIRYDTNNELKNLLMQVFSFSYKFLNVARKKARLIEEKKKVYATVPNEQAEFIDFCSTGRAFEYEMIFRPLNGKTQIDNNYQKDIEEIIQKNHVEYNDSPQKKMGKTSSYRTSYKRDRNVGRNAIVNANFLCEVDSNHKDFVSRITGRNYVEAHHLIPIEFQENFEVSIDVEANVISLCVSCHKKLHHAKFNEIKHILKYLFNKRKKRLERSGIIINEEILYDFYR